MIWAQCSYKVDVFIYTTTMSTVPLDIDTVSPATLSRVLTLTFLLVSRATSTSCMVVSNLSVHVHLIYTMHISVFMRWPGHTLLRFGVNFSSPMRKPKLTRSAFIRDACCAECDWLQSPHRTHRRTCKFSALRCGTLTGQFSEQICCF